MKTTITWNSQDLVWLAISQHRLRLWVIARISSYFLVVRRNNSNTNTREFNSKLLLTRRIKSLMLSGGKLLTTLERLRDSSPNMSKKRRDWLRNMKEEFKRQSRRQGRECKRSMRRGLRRVLGLRMQDQLMDLFRQFLSLRIVTTQLLSLKVEAGTQLLGTIQFLRQESIPTLLVSP